jgi:hypothetical protein
VGSGDEVEGRGSGRGRRDVPDERVRAPARAMSAMEAPTPRARCLRGVGGGTYSPGWVVLEATLRGLIRLSTFDGA